MARRPWQDYMKPRDSSQRSYVKNIYSTKDDPFFNKNVPPVEPTNRFLARAIENRGMYGGQQPQGQCEDVSSSAINTISYDNRSRRLFVTFNSGRKYTYFDVNASQYDA